MANPFKEAEKAKKKPAGNPHTPVEKKEEVVPVPEEEKVVKREEETKEVKEVKETKKTKEEKPTASNKKANLFAGLNPEKEKETFSTQAFYLSDKNIEKLKKAAEKQGVSVSKLLNYIISEVL